MSLEERFTFNCRECDFEENAKQCVQIADEYAVGFQNWIEDTIQTNPKQYINLTTWELLEIYKQGL